jgi:plasmid stabilization system protein ParE
MTSDQGFKLHPEAARDITEIWEYIVEENPLAAGRVREDILTLFANSCPFQIKVTNDRTSPHSRCGSRLCAITSSPTHLKKSRSLSLPCSTEAAIPA